MRAKFDLFDVSLVAAGFLVPLVFMKVQLGILQISIIEVIVPLMVIGFLLRMRREKWKLQFSIPDKIYLLILIWTGLSLFKAIDLTKSLNEWIWLLESGLVFYMVEHGIKGKEKIIRLVMMWSYGAIAVATLGLLHYGSSIFAGDGPVRVSSTLLNANTLSGYLIIFIPVLIAFKYGRRLDQRIFWGILATILSTALVATYTRGGWIAIILALSIMALMLKDKSLIGFMIVYILIYSWAVPSVTERAATGLDPMADGNGNARIHLWLTGLKMAQEAPITGVGVGNYYHLHDAYMDKYPEVGQGFIPLEPHNSFIKYLAETGLVGLSLFFLFLGVIATRILALFKHLRSNPLIIGTLCGMIAFLLQSNTNSLFHDSRVAFAAWMVIGMVTNFTGKVYSEYYGSSFPFNRLCMPTRGLKYEPKINFIREVKRMELLKRLVVEEEGQGMAEYALILAGIAVVVMVVIGTLGTAISNKFTQITNKLNSN